MSRTNNGHVTGLSRTSREVSVTESGLYLTEQSANQTDKKTKIDHILRFFQYTDTIVSDILYTDHTHTVSPNDN